MSTERYYLTIAIICIMVVGIVAYIRHALYLAWFRKEATTGTVVKFYREGELVIGEIMACDSSTVVISSGYGTFKRFRADIYPV